MELPGIKGNYDHPLFNRMIKNYRHLKKKYQKKGTDCFRIYDRDMPEYRLSADLYCGRFVLQYYSGDDGNGDIPADMKDMIREGLQTVFGTPENFIFWKIRKKRDMLEQYEKLESGKNFFTCHENGSRFLINAQDYLDSGLFLDHAPLREYTGSISSGKKVLNLFSYTSSITVYAAAGGAVSSVSVDMSNTYTEWAVNNFRLNGMDPNRHVLVREDCLKYLERAQREQEKFDIIIADPPTISRSKKMEKMFDVNRDHEALIEMCSKLLEGKDSVILFSTNSRKFSMDKDIFLRFDVRDITSRTIPEGFRDKKIHKVYLIKLK